MDVDVGKEHPGSLWHVRINSRPHGTYGDVNVACAEAIDIAQENTAYGKPSAAYFIGDRTKRLWPP